MNENFSSWFWMALCASIALFIITGFWAWFRYLVWQERRLDAMHGKAFHLYIETGEITEAFHTISLRDFKAATRQRMDRIRQRDLESRIFKSECPCPACRLIEVHWINLVKTHRIGHIMRECRECGHMWRQD